jgi:hypothetical protein
MNLGGFHIGWDLFALPPANTVRFNNDNAIGKMTDFGLNLNMRAIDFSKIISMEKFKAILWLNQFSGAIYNKKSELFSSPFVISGKKIMGQQWYRRFFG